MKNFFYIVSYTIITTLITITIMNNNKNYNKADITIYFEKELMLNGIIIPKGTKLTGNGIIYNHEGNTYSNISINEPNIYWDYLSYGTKDCGKYLNGVSYNKNKSMWKINDHDDDCG